MARPIKNNADYFSHDSGMRNNRKIKALRIKHGINGYAVFCMTLEMLTDADNFMVTVDDIELEIIAADFGLTTVELRDIWETLKNLRLIQFENDKLNCPALIERLQPVLDERTRQRGKAIKRWKNKNESMPIDYYTQVLPGEKYASAMPGDNSTKVLTWENYAVVMQSKGKESKEEKINKKKTFTPPSLTEIQYLFTEKIKEKGLTISPAIEAEKFESHYGANGWMIGKNKMKDWRKAVSGWIARNPGSINGTKIHEPAKGLKR